MRWSGTTNIVLMSAMGLRPWQVPRRGSAAMRVAETNGSVVHEENVPFTDPRRMTRAQLRRLGMPRVVYLRRGTINGRATYAVHAADGTAMAVADDLYDAIEFVSASDMTVAAVH